MSDREKLIEVLSKYFDIADPYAYNLTRDKTAFAVGTMSLEDFEEFNEETMADIADHLIANEVVIQKRGEWILVDKKKGTGVCSNCHRLEHIDPLDSYCRYCGASMRKGE